MNECVTHKLLENMIGLNARKTRLGGRLNMNFEIALPIEGEMMREVNVGTTDWAEVFGFGGLNLPSEDNNMNTKEEYWANVPRFAALEFPDDATKARAVEEEVSDPQGAYLSMICAGL